MTLVRQSFLEVFQDVSGGNAKVRRSDLLESGSVPVVDQGKQLIAGFTNDIKAICKVEPPVIIFGDHTRVLKYVDFPFAMGADGTKVLKSKSNHHLPYLFHFLRSTHIPEAGYSRHFKFLKELQVPVPDPAEQKRIAAILDKTDELKAKRQQAIDELDKLQQAVFLDMFETAEVEQVSIQNLIDGEVITLHKDGNHGSYYPRKAEFGPDGVPFLSASCITDDGRLQPEKVQFLNLDAAARLKNGWIEPGDVLLAHNASVGKCFLYEGLFEKALIGTSLTCFRPDTSRLRSEYLLAAFRSGRFQFQLESNMGQTTRNQVPITAQRKLTIGLPPISLQDKFAAVLDSINKLKEAKLQSEIELEALISALRAKAFKGEL